MKKNIYFALFTIVFLALFFSAWYYFWVQKWVFEAEKWYEKFLKTDINSSWNIFNSENEKTEKVEEIKEEKVNSWVVEKNRTIKKQLIEENEKKKNEVLNSWSFKETKTWVLEENLWENIWKINNFWDFSSDNSLQKFVNSKVSFNDKKYVPQDLVKFSSEFIIDTKGNQTLRKEASENLQEMWKKFFNETWEKIKVVSAYRSYEYQVWIKKWGCPDNLCAKAWFSEHQTWLTVDLWSASNQKTWKNDKKLSEYFAWLNENAHNFGFHNTYQKWLNVDWYDVEPWHWRYVWVEFATYLKQNNLTIAEYYNSL